MFGDLLCPDRIGNMMKHIVVDLIGQPVIRHFLKLADFFGKGINHLILQGVEGIQVIRIFALLDESITQFERIFQLHARFDRRS